MKPRWTLDIWLRLAFLAIAIALLGIAPLPHAATQALHQAARATPGKPDPSTSQAFAQAAQMLPWRGDLWEYAGSSALDADEPLLAVEYLTRAAQYEPPTNLSETGWLALGDAYRWLDRLPEAVEAWNSGMDRYGASVQALERLWPAYLALGQLDEAAAALRALLVLTPQDARTHYRLGLLLAAFQPEQAFSALDQAARLDYRFGTAAGDIRRALLSARPADNPAYTHTMVGRALAALGEWDLAEESFRRATVLQPGYAEAWAYLGEARQHSGERMLELPDALGSDGLMELQRALQLDPRSVSAHTFLSLYWSRSAEYDRALITIRNAIQLDPKNPALQVQYAGILASSGDLTGAHDAYLRAIDLSPHEPAYRLYLVEFSLEYEYEMEAIALPVARSLAASFSDRPEYQDLLGRVMIQLGDLESAARFFDRALALNPQYAEAHMHLGVVYALRGDRAQAWRELNRAIALASGTPTAAQAQRLKEIYFP